MRTKASVGRSTLASGTSLTLIVRGPPYPTAFIHYPRVKIPPLLRLQDRQAVKFLQSA